MNIKSGVREIADGSGRHVRRHARPPAEEEERPQHAPAFLRSPLSSSISAHTRALTRTYADAVGLGEGDRGRFEGTRGALGRERHTHAHTYTRVCICICIYMCVCVCASWTPLQGRRAHSEREPRRRGDSVARQARCSSGALVRHTRDTASLATHPLHHHRLLRRRTQGAAPTRSRGISRIS